MHGLNTITKLNNETLTGFITNYQAQGRYVVVEYTGLHISSIQTFEDPLEAVSNFNRPVGSPDVTRKIFPPSATRPVPRDQSEDKTLGDYISRKQAAAGIDLESGEFIPAANIPHHPV